MTRDDYEREAQQVADYARMDERDCFQARRPHYTPPPWAKPAGAFWQRWRQANLNLHGSEAACAERFGSLWHDATSQLIKPPG